MPSCSQRHTVLILRIGNGLSSLIKSLFTALEGDGEEVFSQMVDDLLCMASLVDSLYSILGFPCRQTGVPETGDEPGR